MRLKPSRGSTTPRSTERYRVAKITAMSALSTPQTIKLATLLPHVNRCMPEMSSGVPRL